METFELKDIWQLFIFKELCYQTIGGDFFLFARKSNREGTFSFLVKNQIGSCFTKFFHMLSDHLREFPKLTRNLDFLARLKNDFQQLLIWTPNLSTTNHAEIYARVYRSVNLEVKGPLMCIRGLWWMMNVASSCQGWQIQTTQVAGAVRVKC